MSAVCDKPVRTLSRWMYHHHAGFGRVEPEMHMYSVQTRHRILDFQAWRRSVVRCESHALQRSAFEVHT